MLCCTAHISLHSLQANRLPRPAITDPPPPRLPHRHIGGHSKEQIRWLRAVQRDVCSRRPTLNTHQNTSRGGEVPGFRVRGGIAAAHLPRGAVPWTAFTNSPTPSPASQEASPPPGIQHPLSMGATECTVYAVWYAAQAEGGKGRDSCLWQGGGRGHRGGCSSWQQP